MAEQNANANVDVNDEVVQEPPAAAAAAGAAVQPPPAAAQPAVAAAADAQPPPAANVGGGGEAQPPAPPPAAAPAPAGAQPPAPPPAAAPAPAGAAHNVVLGPAQFQELLGAIQHPQQQQQRRERSKLTPFVSTQPADWREFRQRCNVGKAINGWGEHDAKQMVRNACEGPAAKRMMTVSFGGDPALDPVPADAKTYEQYMNDVELRFQHREASAIAISDFKKARMRAEEDYVAWHTRLYDIYVLAYPNRDGETDQDLIRAFIMGLDNQVIADHLMDRDPQAYQQCLTIAQSKQGRMAQVRDAMRSRPGRINAFGDGVNAMHDGYDDDDDYYVVAGDDCGVGAVNYDTGTKKVSTTARNRYLRRFGPGGGSRICTNCESLDHRSDQCPHLNAMHRNRGPKKGGRAKNARGNKKPAAGRGRWGKNNRGGNKVKGGKRRPGPRRGAHALGEDSDDDYPEAVAALDCLEHLSLYGNERGN